MIKRIETFLANIFRREIAPVKNDLAAALLTIAKLRGDIADLHARFEQSKAHTESVAAELREHAAEVAADLHAKIAADTKMIALLRNMVRLPCVLCGQMSGSYETIAGKVVCLDCRAKGRP